MKPEYAVHFEISKDGGETWRLPTTDDIDFLFRLKATPPPVTDERLKELEEAEEMLEALRAGGVDNWQGYHDAIKHLIDDDDDEDKPMTRTEILEQIWSDVEHLFKCCFADHEGIGHAKDDLLEQWGDMIADMKEEPE